MILGVNKMATYSKWLWFENTQFEHNSKFTFLLQLFVVLHVF